MEALKRIRESRKISQEELAKLVRVDRSSVAKWETTDGYPRGETLIALADVLDCTIDAICGREPAASPPIEAAS